MLAFFARPLPTTPTTTRTPAGLHVVALGAYAGALAERIRALKYREETRHAKPLGRLLGALLPGEWLEAALVPIPLHPERLAERGYNQASLLARAIARPARLRVEFELLAREKRTLAQARLDKAARALNTQAAFVRPRRAAQRLVLVDDVATTGSTLEAAAAALTGAGHRVLGAVVVALGGDDARALERPPELC